MQEEVNAINCKETWDPVGQPQDRKVVAVNFIYKIKTSIDGEKYGQDYDEVLLKILYRELFKL